MRSRGWTTNTTCRVRCPSRHLCAVPVRLIAPHTIPSFKGRVDATAESVIVEENVDIQARYKRDMRTKVQEFDCPLGSIANMSGNERGD